MTDATERMLDAKDAADRRAQLARTEGYRNGQADLLELAQVQRDAMAAGGQRVTEIDALLDALRAVLEVQG